MKEKVKREAALIVATELVNLLTPVTERIEICGSIRRGKPEVSDIELVFVPKVDQIADGLFDTKPFDRAADKLDWLLREGVIAKRPNVNGHFSWGAQNKLAVHCKSGIAVDLFSTTEDKWWMSLVVRTGSKELNQRLCESAIRKGWQLHAYGNGFTDNKGQSVRATSEEHVFQLAGCKYLLPYQRNT